MGPPVVFPATLWTSILRAQRDDPEALNRFALRYRPPVVAYLLQKGFSSDDAEELAQEVFARICERRILQRADEARGRLRSLLLGVTENIVREHRRARHAQKRGEGHAPVSLDQDEALKNFLAKTHRNQEFDRHWARHIVSQALETVRRETPHYVQALELLLGGVTDRSEIARRMQRSVKEIYNFLQRGRTKLIAAVQDQIAAYASSEGEYKDEVQALLPHLNPPSDD